MLAELDRRVARSRQTGALVGPTGLGRTHLLRVFSQRVDPSRLQCVYLSQARFDFPDLCRICVAAATGRSPADQPEEALRQLLRDVWRDGRSLLVLLDDADSMPSSTVDAWLELTIQQVPSLLSLFVTRDEAAAPCVDGLAMDAPIVRFSVPMSEAETCDYVVDRLLRVGARPETFEHFPEAVLEQLYMLSQGWPVRLHAIAQVYLDLADRSPELARAWLVDLAATASRQGGDAAAAEPAFPDKLSA